MKTIRRFFFLLTTLIFFSESIFAQEKEPGSPVENALHHRVSFIISHSYLPVKNESTGEKKTFTAASLGLNYELWFNSSWAIGLHNDITMESFRAEDKGDGNIAEKEFPVLTSVVAMYKPWKHWSIFAGPGKEFEKSENFFLVKTGIEYGVELPKEWEIGFGVDYDIKINGYNSWLIGIGISKIFTRK